MQPAQGKQFYVVSLGKLALLYFCTLGLYRFYWFFKGFAAMEGMTGRRMFPIGRTLFYVLFTHELFGFIRACQRRSGDEYPWQPNKLAWLVVGVNLLQVFGMLSIAGYQASWFLHLLMLVTVHFVQFAALYKVQLIVNRIERDPFGDVNSRVTLQNRLWIVFGAMLWAQTIYGYYLQATGQWPPPAPASAPQEAPPSSP